jgi:hypothetical protein
MSIMSDVLRSTYVDYPTARLDLSASGGSQTPYKLRLLAANSSTIIWRGSCTDVLLIDCTRSDNVPLGAFPVELQPAMTYTFAVQPDVGDWSAPFAFSTALGAPAEKWPGGAVPIWASNPLQQFVLFRRAFELPSTNKPMPEHLLHITAHPVPTRILNAGANATKLLCSYKLWINGAPVAVAWTWRAYR